MDGSALISSKCSRRQSTLKQRRLTPTDHHIVSGNPEAAPRASILALK